MEAVVSSVLRQLTSIRREIQEDVTSTIEEIRLDVSRVEGVDLELKMLTKNLDVIQAVIVAAEQSQLKEVHVRVWFDKLRDTCYDLEDVLDEWRTALQKWQIEEKVTYPLPSPRDIAFKIKKLNEELDAIAPEKDIYGLNLVRSHINKELDRPISAAFDDGEQIYGRDQEMHALIRMLLERSSEGGEALAIISIVGMAGIGKTTLAQLAYNHSDVINHFEKRIWLGLPDPFDEFIIGKNIIEALEIYTANLEELGSILVQIREFIKGKRFLLVLDDACKVDYDKWQVFYYCLKEGGRGSKILITTREETVAQKMQSTSILALQKLSDQQSWLLFKQLALSGRSFEEYEKLEAIGRKFIYMCRGHPFATKIIGSLLRSKRTREEWEILNREMLKLEQANIGTFPSLMFSYNDLPSTIKRCFLYCANFPKNYLIEKEQLIKLWMAQGYLESENNEDMEIIGQQYFNNLETRSFIRNFRTGHDGSLLYCRMDGAVYEFVQFLNINYCLPINVNSIEDPLRNFFNEKFRHSMLVVGARASFPVSICSFKKLRSLVIRYGAPNYFSISNILPKLFDELLSLRALDLSGKKWYENLILEIPKEIGKLIHLRYLNLSSTKIKELPETLCELCNLQNLELSWCSDLKKLPEGMSKLINLRHLVNSGTSLSYMPKGIDRLTCLRTLNEFFVSGDGNRSDASSLGSLKNLNHLEGSLCIKNLGNAVDVDEARRAELKDKKNLLSLYLNFERDVEEERVNEAEERWRVDKDEAVLEALEPPPELEKLEIGNYRGNTMFPNWIMSLTNLRMLSLHDCMNFKHLPPLGKLSSLESLSICNMKSVKRVDDGFLGIESGDTSLSSAVAFAKLVSLKFVNMEEWEEWDCGTVMPCLCSLSFLYCPKLKALPVNILPSEIQKELSINWCPILEERYTKWTGEDWHKISHIPNVMINFEIMQRDGL